ncbi:hypothetical protein AHAS_Ahas01G0037700 [Arachis hypogaea]
MFIFINDSILNYIPSLLLNSSSSSFPFACSSKRVECIRVLSTLYSLLINPSSNSSSGLMINMSSDYKLDIVDHHHDPEELALDDENPNAVNTIFNGIHEQAKMLNNFATNLERRALNDRFLKTSKVTEDDDEGRRLHRSAKKSGPLISGTAYCISSCSMIMLNKIVLSSYNFNAGISLMFYQNLISTLVVVLLSLFGRISVERLNWRLVRVWIPVNVIFISMLVSGMYSLKFINIAMVTILKNVTNILTAIGELYLFRKHQNSKVWAAMFLMIISAVSGGITDLSFDGVGYAWQIINCVLTASYSLTLRWVMDEAKKATKSGSLNEVSMVLLNNLLSLPLAIVLIFVFGELDYQCGEVANVLGSCNCKWIHWTFYQLHINVVLASNWTYHI